MKRIAAIAALLLTTAAAVPAAATASTTPPTQQCAQLVIARINPITGHEADFPIKVCGLHRSGTWECPVPWGTWPTPGQTLNCTKVKAPSR